MALEIFSGNQWSTFQISDFADTERMKELKNLTPFAQVLKVSSDELNFVKIRFSNLPVTKGNVCTWRNPFCEFILSNLIEVES